MSISLKDTDDAIRVLNDINQLNIGELISFNVYDEYCIRPVHNRYNEEEQNADND